jgi:formate hydrogenlyase transcriptional activator
MPALRERREDIPLLVWFFVKKFAKRMNKTIKNIRNADMDAMIGSPWPGNVRELKNVIERSVVMSRNETLHCQLATPMAEPKRAYETSEFESVTLVDIERQHIVRALENTGWIVGGPYGAASRLGVKRTTLLYKMDLLGISRRAKSGTN